MALRLLPIAMLIVASVAAVADASPISWRRYTQRFNRYTHRLNRFRCDKQPQLVCVLRPTEGNSVSGVMKFRAVHNQAYRPWRWSSKRCHVRITADVSGLTPGKHGTHAHAFGDERKPDGSALGPHFANPWFIPVDHGLRADRVRHWGDFGNMEARADGVARLRYDDRVITIKGIVGRGIIVHGGEDQGAAFQPSGSSGPRVASCVIGYANSGI